MSLQDKYTSVVSAAQTAGVADLKVSRTRWYFIHLWNY